MDNKNREDIISRRIAEALKLELNYVSRVITLLDEGNTIPFIARYRKEVSGGMTDEELRLLGEKLSFNRNLENRRADIHRLMDEQGVLTQELAKLISQALNVTELEDIYRPFKPKKRTRATIAREKGLEPLALLILDGQKDPEAVAPHFISGEKEVFTAHEALAGARDIIAEVISDEPKLRPLLRAFVFKEGFISANARSKEMGIYEMYYNYREPCRKVQPHRILAINRGEREEFLNVKIEVPEARAHTIVQNLYQKANFTANAKLQLEEAMRDSWKRLLFPSLEREVRSELTRKAEERAIRVFQENLRHLLMLPPIRGKRIMALDPGLRTGCKVACVDERGKLLETAVIYPIPPRNEKEKATQVILALLEKHELNAIAIGNGTGGRETERFVVELLEAHGKEVAYTVVNEAGASVYSASKLGQAEFPDLDVSERSAVSLARRVQDAMAELVKIDPRSIGVGQYQHDVNQKKLTAVLEGVVESCVNQVGVDLNTASPALLEHVAGINKIVAGNIFSYRENNGPFNSRKELKKVPKLGPAAFKQCAGFLRIPAAENYLDRTAVHPESYETADKLMHLIGIAPTELGQEGELPQIHIRELAVALQVGEPTLRDILEEFKKPGRDPRDDLPQPVFKKGILNIEDLNENMEIQGVIRNVVDFGAFVDIGVHVDGLIHISELSDRFIKHPLDVVKVGDIVNVRVLSVDLEKKRISLSMKVPIA